MRTSAQAIDVFHCSDVHFGHPAVPEQYETIEAMIQERKFDVVVISGDLTQRSRSGEFQRARAFIKHAERVSKVVVVPGTHDVAWWRAPVGRAPGRRGSRATSRCSIDAARCGAASRAPSTPGTPAT